MTTPRSNYSNIDTKAQCEHCGEDKQMYYSLWCPLCEKPQIKSCPTLNFLQAQYHVDRKVYGETDSNIDPPGKRDVWMGLCDGGWIRNDSTTYLPLVPAAEGDGSIGALDDNAIKYLQALVKEFNLDAKENDNLQYEISW